MIEGTIDGRRFSLDYSGDRLKADFEDAEDKEFMLDFQTYAYHPTEGPGLYAIKDSLVGAQACIDVLIASRINIVITKGMAEQYSDINFE